MTTQSLLMETLADPLKGRLVLHVIGKVAPDFSKR